MLRKPAVEKGVSRHVLRLFRLLPLTVRSEKGFTLIEIMVVVAIISILVATALPQFTRQSDRAREAATLAGLRSMKAVVEQYYAERSRLPEADNSDTDGTVKRVMNESGIPWGNLSDPWGGFYTYRVNAQKTKYIIFTTRDNSTYYFVTDQHGPTVGPFPEGYPLSGGVPSKASDTGGTGSSGSDQSPQPPPEPPSVSTLGVANVTATSATLIMAYDFKGYGSGQVQFAYKPSGGAYVYTPWVDKAGAGPYTETVGGLTPNTTYYFKARLKYDSTVVESSELSFTTSPSVSPTVTTKDARRIGRWKIAGGSATGTVQVKAAITYGDYRQVDISIRYRTSGGTWTYTPWETITSASYVKNIQGSNWVPGETYYFEALIRFGSPYHYAYGGEKAVEVPSPPPPPPRSEPEPPPPPGDQEQ